MVDNKSLRDISNVLRREVLEMTTAAGSGHPSSCLSAADIMSVLFFSAMDHKKDNFILSKGHAAPLLYSAMKNAGETNESLLDLRKLTSPLEGHPTPALKGIKYATGSLGQGLSLAAGVALAMKIKKESGKSFVLLGDSETAEGQVWEAVEFAEYYNLNNLVAIFDINGLGQRGKTMLEHKTLPYYLRLHAFGWETTVVDGHNISQILHAFKKASKAKKPFAILAQTIKGKGVSFIQNKQGWHGKSLSQNELKKALAEIPLVRMPKIKIKLKTEIDTRPIIKVPEINDYNPSQTYSTREAYGNALAKLASANKHVLALDGEVSNSTFSDKVKEKTPKQFIECFIAEQNMIDIAQGLSIKGFNTYSSTFSAFLSRAHDQLRMSAVSRADMTICGSHAGVSIGEDGASQMGLEDISIFRSLPSSIVLYPCDAYSTEKLVFNAAQIPGIKYIRTTRPKLPLVYDKYESFKIGDFKVVKQSENDKVVLIGAGITLHESLKAHKKLSESNISAAVVDIYCIKPLNTSKLIEFIKNHGGKVIITEDHYKEGGIGEMLSTALINSGVKFSHLAVNQVPHSGKKEELMRKYRIDSEAIVEESKKI